jgi:pimeloyl-ACP methyl ester carboxylesterase
MGEEELAGLLAMVGGRSLGDTKAFLDRLAKRPLRRNWVFAPEMRRIFRRPALQALVARAHHMPLLTVSELQQLRMPVTVVWGRHERLLPEAHLAFWSQLPQVRVLRPDRAGHSPAYDRPWWFERMLREELGLGARFAGMKQAVGMAAK